MSITLVVSVFAPIHWWSVFVSPYIGGQCLWPFTLMVGVCTPYIGGKCLWPFTLVVNVCAPYIKGRCLCPLALMVNACALLKWRSMALPSYIGGQCLCPVALVISVCALLTLVGSVCESYSLGDILSRCLVANYPDYTTWQYRAPHLLFLVQVQ